MDPKAFCLGLYRANVMRCGARIRLGNIQPDLQLGGIWRVRGFSVCSGDWPLDQSPRTSRATLRLHLDTTRPGLRQSSQDLSTFARRLSWHLVSTPSSLRLSTE